ncbi:MAG TPA: ABC transporter substrate-binding protein [Candidatus Tectomicrobia bacterium]|nr:ABC transporter substrate-binding protein [Candidatus Tectomicrobia bacterium]
MARGIDHIAVLSRTLLSEAMSRRAFLRTAGLGAMAAAGAGALAPAAAQTVKRGGQLRLGWIDTVDTLDPHFTSSLGAIKIHDNIYNGILKVEYDGKRVSFVPDVIETWDMPNPTTHVLKVRPGVKFHDGTDCDAEAIKWNQERVKDPNVKSSHAWKLAYLDKVTVVDKRTVRITFTKPYQFLPVAWTGSTGRAGTIVSPTAVQKHGRAYGRNPVGTGPYVFKEWVENDRIVLERNPNYFEKGADGKPLPYLDRVTILLIREPSTAVGALMSGELDGLSLVPFQFLPMLSKNPNIRVEGGVEGNYTFIGMNTRKPPFDDRALRQAVSFAVDRAPIVEQAYFGGAIQACSAISPPMSDFYRPDQCSSRRAQYYDLAKAKALRAESKYKGDVEAEWMVVGGYTGSGGVGPRMAELVQPMLAQIGIKVKIQLYEQATWHKKRNSGDFQMYDEGWVADLDPDETIYPEWVTGKPWNFVGYSNPEFDRLVSEAQFETNLARRKELYDKADLILAADAPAAFIAHFKVFKALSKKVQGFRYIPADSFKFHTLALT